LIEYYYVGLLNSLQILSKWYELIWIVFEVEILFRICLCCYIDHNSLKYR